MSNFPDEFIVIIIQYAGLFSKPLYSHVKLLLAGAILAPAKRTVSSVLSILGLAGEKNFHKYHWVLSHAKWSALQGSNILLKQLLDSLLPSGTVLLGIDETLERRWGNKIKKRAIYRDSVRSSRSHFVKGSGLRWISLMLLNHISWANRIWATVARPYLF
jgi:hypothetical protein